MSQDRFHAEVMAELEQAEARPIFPPVPTTAYDYCATLRSYEPGDPIGYGPTPQAALADLKEQFQ